jgi:acyl carrier protein
MIETGTGATMEITRQVRDFITSNFYVSNPTSLDENASLLEQGVIDSTGILEVIGFIEDTFQIEVTDSEMVPDNLDSIARIVRFVRSKQN